MDTCVRVIGVGILELNRNSIGPGSSELGWSGLNPLGATLGGTVVLSTRSVILYWRLGPRFTIFYIWSGIVNANDPCASIMRMSLRGKSTRKHWYD